MSDTLTASNAQQQLDKAREARRKLDDKIARGEKVSGADLSHVDADVRVAELAVEAAADAEHQAAEQQCQARIAELADSVTDGHLAQQAACILQLRDEAEAALAKLYDAAAAYNDEQRQTLHELHRLNPTEPDVTVKRGATGVSGNIRGLALHPDRELGRRLVGHAAHAVIKAREGRNQTAYALQKGSGAAHDPTDRLRREAGNGRHQATR